MKDSDPEQQFVLVDGWKNDFTLLLKALPFFEGMAQAALQAVANQLEWFSLPAGETLFQQGEVPDALYIVVAGSLGAYAPVENNQFQMVAVIAPGEMVGEMALISGRPRSATIRSIRDTELLRFAKADFEALITEHPYAMLQLARLTVRRLESANIHRRTTVQPRTFALVPQGPQTQIRPFSIALTAALSAIKSAELVIREQGVDQTSDWFDRIEASCNFVIYEADWQATAWSRLCLRQADSIILVGDAATEASSFPVLAEIGKENVGERRIDLVLLQDRKINSLQTAEWLTQHSTFMHHHIREAKDVGRLSRILAGRGVGLVLSGGGARGFAHIGVIRALREANIPIDVVGGTSMGAIVAAGVAAEWTYEEMRERYHRCFVTTNPINDYTLPIFALVSGRKVSRLLRNEFGLSRIEDLPLPFFCLTANLTRGKTTTHREGLVWRWLRAAVAIPGILPPIFDFGDVHVDAGGMNNLPIDILRELNSGSAIAVDVGADTAFTADNDQAELPPLWRVLLKRQKNKLPNIFQILLRAGTINAGAHTQMVRELADLVFQPPLETVDMLNWRAFDQAIDGGYRYAMEKLEESSKLNKQPTGLFLT